MGWWKRSVRKTKQKAKVAQGNREVSDEVKAHLEDFVKTRKGVESWVEPQTSFSQTSMLLVAADGEWTRRKVPSAQWAHNFARKLGIPAYDAGVIGYPQRMRDWEQKQRILKKRQKFD